MTFKELGLNDQIIQALTEVGYEIPTPIQEKAIPHILEKKDLLGSAQTGTGKTAAFALPIINSLLEMPTDHKIKALILTPTRELAMQIRDNVRTYTKGTKLFSTVIVGGVNQKPQVDNLKRGVDIVIATPGRLLDLINQRYVKLDNVQTVVLDEADTMLDMGFIQDITKIMERVPANHQTLMFSATMPKAVDKMVAQFLTNPVKVIVNPESSTVDKINQSLYYVDKQNKTSLLLDLLDQNDIKSVLIFTRTKHGANKLAINLMDSGLNCEVIHGNKSQNQRSLALRNFKSGKSNILVATDVAARGIDIAELSHVINFEIPNPSENYVHRIGRTGRAGLTGEAISFCDIDEAKDIQDIQRITKQNITVVEGHKFPMKNFDLSPKSGNGNFRRGGRNSGSSGGRSSSAGSRNNSGSNNRGKSASSGRKQYGNRRSYN